MIRYKLGLMGMEESEHGEYLRWDYHTQEIKQWSNAHDSNKHLAETLLREQDEELERKNKEIYNLKEAIKDAGGVTYIDVVND